MTLMIIWRVKLLEINKIVEKAVEKTDGIKYGTVKVTLSVHDGKIVKVEYETSEKEVIK